MDDTINKIHEKAVKKAEKSKAPIPTKSDIPRCSKMYQIQNSAAIRDTQSYMELYSLLFQFFPEIRTEIPEARNKYFKVEVTPAFKDDAFHIHAFKNEMFNLNMRLFASGASFGTSNFKFSLADESKMDLYFCDNGRSYNIPFNSLLFHITKCCNFLRIGYDEQTSSRAFNNI